MEPEFLIHFSDCDNDVLRARVIGVRTLSSTIGYWQAIAEQLAPRRPSGLLLIDELKGEELSASDWEMLVARMQGRGLEGILIAHVKPFALDQIVHCEISAVAAGLQARVFRDETEAMHWLAPMG